MLARLAQDLGVRENQVRATVDLLDSGADCAVRGPVPQGGHRRAGRRRAARPRRAAGYLRELEQRRAAVLESVRRAGQADAGARGADPRRPTPRPASRTSTCRTSRSGARRRRSPARRGSSRWRSPCSRDPSLDPQAAAAGFVDARRASPTSRPRSTARARSSWSGSRRTPTSSASCASGCGAADGCRRAWCRARRRRARSSPTVRARRAADQAALAPHPRDVPRREGGRARPRARPRPPRPSRPPRRRRLRGADRCPLRHRRPGPAADRWLLDAVRWAWRTRILVHLDLDLRLRLRQVAEDEAVRVFAGNLRDLLLAAPAGMRPTMGLDPGCAPASRSRSSTRRARSWPPTTIYPHVPHRQLGRGAAHARRALATRAPGRARRHRQRHRLARDDELAAELAAQQPGAAAHPGRRVRGRRVGVLGVGVRLARAARARRLAARRRLDRAPVAGPARRARQDRPEVDRRRAVPARPHRGEAVEVPRRRRRGLRERGRRRRQHRVRAAAAPRVRDQRGARRRASSRTGTPTGAFRSRGQLLAVPRLGPKAFEQCAGFLRIRDGDDPLDASSVHPEAYPVVRRIVAQTTGRRAPR